MTTNKLTIGQRVADDYYSSPELTKKRLATMIDAAIAVIALDAEMHQHKHSDAEQEAFLDMQKAIESMPIEVKPFIDNIALIKHPLSALGSGIGDTGGTFTDYKTVQLEQNRHACKQIEKMILNPTKTPATQLPHKRS